MKKLWLARVSLKKKQNVFWISISEKVGVELRGYLVIPKIKIIYTIVDDIVYIEYIKNTWLSEETMLRRMGYCL